MPTVRVRIVLGNAQQRLAQIWVDTTAKSKRLPISAFSQEMQAALASLGPNEEVVCEPEQNPTPENVRPAPAAAVPPAKQAVVAGGGAAQGGYQVRRPPVAPAPGAVSRTALSAGPLDRNPYNFAEWDAGEQGKSPGPWILDDGYDGVTHDRWHAGRLSGTLRLRLTARTPIFIPEGDLRRKADREGDRSPLTFWHCRDARGHDRPAIPGSSVKGVVRTLFETWTNSRLTVVSERLYERPIPFRRRTAQLWVITSTTPGGDLQVRRCDVEFAQQTGGGWHLRSKQPPPPAADIVVNDRTGIDGTVVNVAETRCQAVRYPANLLWTPDHTHWWTHLLVRVRSGPADSATIPVELVNRYETYVNDPREEAAISCHLKRVEDIIRGGPGRNYYRSVKAESTALVERRRHLARLEPGDWVFGIPEPAGRGGPARLACFGKNVNFMFPAARSPESLAGDFMPSEEKVALPATAGATNRDTSPDTTQTTFGFAGAYPKGGTPFRGRVRFGTFWAHDGYRVASHPLQLRALTSPTGIKLKARSLYLPPAGDGQTQSYDEAPRLRGRKFYWHQRVPEGLVGADHVTDSPDAQCPPPIQPIEAGAAFEGDVHFDNLSELELGALLAALCPALLLGSGDGAEYGWKIGKGKPRGLGSVVPAVVAFSRRPADVRASYGSLGARAVVEEAEPEAAARALVSQFGRWLDDQSRTGRRGDLPFVADLAGLLRLPDRDRTLNYAAIEVIAGPPPKFDSPTGDAHVNPAVGRTLRPRAMRRARDLRDL